MCFYSYVDYVFKINWAEPIMTASQAVLTDLTFALSFPVQHRPLVSMCYLCFILLSPSLSHIATKLFGSCCIRIMEGRSQLLNCNFRGKGKGKRGFVWRLVVNTPLRRSGIACVLKGSHSFTCTSCIHLLTEWTIPRGGGSWDLSVVVSLFPSIVTIWFGERLKP